MKLKIKSLNIHSFRGIKNTNLEMSGKSLLIFGENGTGKSSIVNAIEFILTNNINSLKGAKELKLTKHAPHINSDAENLKIVVKFNNETEIIKKINTVDISNNSELKEYIEEANNGSFILTREKLLKFIKAAPKERYGAIESIIGLEELDKIEVLFKKTDTEFKKKLEKVRNDKEKKYSNIGNLFQKEISSEEELSIAINEKLKKDNLETIDLMEEIEKIIGKVIKEKEELSETNYKETIRSISSFDFEYYYDYEFKKVNDLSEQISTDLSKDRELGTLLEKSLKYISERELGECPLCENKINDIELKKLIEKKLKDFDKEMKIENQLKSLIKSNIEENERLKEKLLELFDLLKNDENTIEFSKNIEKYIEIVENRIIYFNHIQKFEFNAKVEKSYKAISKLQKEINTIKESIIKKCKSKEEEKNRDISNLLEIIISSLNDLKEIRLMNDEEKSMKNKYELIKTINETFQKTKTHAVQNILKEIFNDVNNFYSYIHDGDLISKVRFIQPHSTGIQLKISYLDNEDDPRAFSSEGHLDTLGLCIFLAFIKNFHTKCSLIILDDIVTTVDIPHKEKIARLLFEEFPKKQFIITTHDKLWYKQVSNLERIYKLGHNFQNLEIIGWDVENGPTLSNYKPNWEKIKENLDNNNLNCAANEGRRYLEYTLKRTCEVNNVPLRIGGNYTVSEMKNPAINKIRKMTNKTKFKDYYEKTFQELDKTLIMGNLMSHNNEESENSSINEVKSFCEAVNKLNNSMTCEKCGRYLKFDINSKKIFCTEKKCRDEIT